MSGLPINPTLLEEAWPAQWIAPSEADGDAFGAFGVYHFRRSIDLEEAPDSFVVHTSADNRYQLFVNGERVRKGPARGEIPNWRFETTDLAPHLEAGPNVIAAVVWNFAGRRPVARLSYEAGFVLQANEETHAAVNTDADWKVTENEAYASLQGGFVGAGERVDADVYPWGWEEPGYDGGSWTQARELRPACRSPGPARPASTRLGSLCPEQFRGWRGTSSALRRSTGRRASSSLERWKQCVCERWRRF